jgi:predicted DNA-binding protein (MmcQ/YjbR family)|tara:strand:- start:129 stop:524 length:396 start_codon:yes stop_codon:yes gene_type:complete
MNRKLFAEVNAETILEFAASLPGVTQGFPFDSNTLVFKVGVEGSMKMFALLNLENFTGVNLKCDPERALELREQFEGVKPGYHMNKLHWNTVMPEPDSDVAAELFWDLLIHSYDLVRDSLTKKIKDQIPAR